MQKILRVKKGNFYDEQKLKKYLRQGWKIKSSTTLSGGWDPFKTCLFGCLFFPLALLGKKADTVEYILEK